MEKTNIRYVTPEDIGEPIAFSSIDVSFISLTKVLEPIRNYLTPDGEIVALIKPQFEAGREKVGKKGVVREKSTHREVIEKVAQYAQSIGFEIKNIDFSPIRGPEGNIEYLIHLKKHGAGMAPEISDEMKQELEKVTDRAFETLAHERERHCRPNGKDRFTKQDKRKQYGSFYIIANELKDIGYQITQEIQTYIEENGKKCIVATKDAEGHIVPGTVPQGIECAIVLGGDGTLIRARGN